MGLHTFADWDVIDKRAHWRNRRSVLCCDQQLTSRPLFISRRWQIGINLKEAFDVVNNQKPGGVKLDFFADWSLQISNLLSWVQIRRVKCASNGIFWALKLPGQGDIRFKKRTWAFTIYRHHKGSSKWNLSTFIEKSLRHETSQLRFATSRVSRNVQVTQSVLIGLFERFQLFCNFSHLAITIFNFVWRLRWKDAEGRNFFVKLSFEYLNLF